MRRFALFAEIGCGWVGFLGIGRILLGIYQGSNNGVFVGILLLVAWWIALLLLVVTMNGAGNLGLFCLVPIWIGVPVVSGLSLHY
jgi:hypothetical protein